MTVPHLHLDEDSQWTRARPCPEPVPTLSIGSRSGPGRFGADLRLRQSRHLVAWMKVTLPVHAVPRIGPGVDDLHRIAHDVVVHRRTEGATKLPSGVPVTVERCHRVLPAKPSVTKSSFQLKNVFVYPADSFRGVLHRAGN